MDKIKFNSYLYHYVIQSKVSAGSILIDILGQLIAQPESVAGGSSGAKDAQNLN